MLDRDVNHHSPTAAKIALFRDLFRGRDDFYPRRFESRKTGKYGYQPACANEWVRDLCDKRRVKCAECPNRRFLPLTVSDRDQANRDFVTGMYPMLEDETCFFLAVDFDKESWREDAGAFLETCQHLKLAASLERSRSGQGAHIWLFFNEPTAFGKTVVAAWLTVTRKDGHHPIIFVQCGPVRYRVDAKEQALARPFTHTVHVRPTLFHPLREASPDLG